MSEPMPDPVVAPFGFLMQVPLSGFATFSQAAMLANLQSMAPVVLLLLQNCADPPAAMLLLVELVLLSIELAAPAIEMLATNAATAVSAVNVFMPVLLECAAPPAVDCRIAAL
jgi:hypothetical protein